MIGNKFWLGKVAKKWQQLMVISGTILALGACGPGLDSLAPFAIGGTVTGLTGTVVLQNNGGDNLSIVGNGSFKFKTELASDAAYAVSVLTQPSGQICSVISGSGTATANVTTVSVQCIWTGTKQFGVLQGATFGNSVAIDSVGNIFVAGYTTGVLDGIMQMGSKDVFVTKYDSLGQYLYTRQMGVAGADTQGFSVATDASGNVYVTGSTTGALNGIQLTGTKGFFITKFDNSLTQKYTVLLGVEGAETVGTSIATDTIGNVYVAGYTTGGLDGNLPRGTHDFFVAKYNSLGQHQYTQQLGVAVAGTIATSVATDANGNVYVAGYTSGGLDGNTLAGTTDFFVTKYDSRGTYQFTRQLGAAGANTSGRSVSTDASGNVYVAGDTSGNLDGNVQVGTIDLFITKYDSSGNKLYTRQRGVADPVTGAATGINSITIDATGNVFVAGHTTGVLEGTTRTGTTDFFVSKYNSDGTQQYTRQLGAAGAITNGNSVAIDHQGNVYVAGDTTGGLDGNTLTGTTDFFVTKFNNSLLK
jgi:hypothetical protein